MTTPRDRRDRRSPPRRHPGPKPYGRTVVPLTVTVTHAQRAELEARADMEKSSISTVVRRFVAAGLIASALLLHTALTEVSIAHRSVAGVLRTARECMR